jgi:Transposase DDE domain
MDDATWTPTVFSKNRDRLLKGDIAQAFFLEVRAAARGEGLLSDEHFTVDGTLLEAWASQKEFSNQGPHGSAGGCHARHGTAERDAAGAMIADLPDTRRVTVAGDKKYDTQKFVRLLREMGVTPHVAQYPETPRRGSAIDARTTRHPGYAVSQQKRKLVEQCFGWMKTVGLLRKLRHRGDARGNWTFIFTAAVFNLVRMRTLLTQPA